MNASNPFDPSAQRVIHTQSAPVMAATSPIDPDPSAELRRTRLRALRLRLRGQLLRQQHGPDDCQ
jgi:hypothetical protein